MQQVKKIRSITADVDPQFAQPHKELEAFTVANAYFLPTWNAAGAANTFVGSAKFDGMIQKQACTGVEHKKRLHEGKSYLTPPPSLPAKVAYDSSLSVRAVCQAPCAKYPKK